MPQESSAGDVNPYAAPQSFPAIDTRRHSSAPPYELYSVGAIVLATFFGSILAGGILMAIDYRRLSNSSTAKICLTLAILAQTLLFGLVFFLPDNIPFTFAVLPQLLAMYSVAQGLLGAGLRGHERSRGQMASLWKAAGIGLACALVEITVIFVGAFLLVMAGVIPIDE